MNLNYVAAAVFLVLISFVLSVAFFGPYFLMAGLVFAAITLLFGWRNRMY